MISSSKPRLIVAFLAFCLLHSGLAPAAHAEDLESLLRKTKANLDRMESGRGAVTWKKYGGYFRADTEEGRVFDATFAFDGEKIRCDHTFRYDRSPQKFAWDGEYSFWASDPPESPRPSIRLGTDDPSRYSVADGERIRFKQLMGPLLNIDETLAALEFMKDINIDSITAEEMFERMKTAEGMDFGEITLDGAAKWVEWMKGPDFECNPAASLEPDGTLKVRMDTGEGSVDIYWFDPAQGYNITREQLIYKERVLQDVSKVYEETGGAWVLKTYAFKRYKPESEELDGWADAEFDNLEINVPIPENTFHWIGFGFPAGTRIVDEVAGTTYELNPEVEIPMPDETAETGAPEAAATESAAGEPGEESEVQEPSAAAATDAAATQEGEGRRVGRVLALFGCGVAIALVLLRVFRRRDRI